MKPTANQRAIYKLLTTSTGAHLCDSGGAYGRHWERNQKRTITDFMNEPEVSFRITRYLYDGDKETEYIQHDTHKEIIFHCNPREDREERVEYEYTISLFHWLDKYFDITQSTALQKSFARLRATDDMYLEERQTQYLERLGFTIGDIQNSCNGDSNLSQVYTVTPLGEAGCTPTYDRGDYILLSIHQGCDVRGGYTHDVLATIKEDYPREDVYGSIETLDGRTIEISNLYDGYRLRTDDTDEEIDPANIKSISLSL